MCGIAGVVSDELARDGRSAALVAEMLRRMRHRGPDGSGVVTNGPVTLGSTRLAVIDTQPHALPLQSHDGRFVIAYNGEAYNFGEVRARLASRGAAFRTHTDTEVVVEAYRQWGPEAIDWLHGMFAFVLLDRQTGELFGARDRMGKKPLFYTHRGGLFAFASFIPSLLAVPGVGSDLDLRAVFDVVHHGYVLGPKTAHRDIVQLPPAHAFTLRDGRLEVFEYWSLADQFRAGCDQDELWRARVREDLALALRRAVRLRLIADVPLGALLSGGIDSSVITALMAEQSTTTVRTFSIGFEEAGFDERAHAEVVARHLRTEHRTEVLRMEQPERLERAQWFVGEPLADTSVLPTYLVSEVARRHVTVALSGDGADELFAGYETFRADAVLSWLRLLPRWPLAPLLRALAARLPGDHGKVSGGYRISRFVSGLDLPEAEAHAHWRALTDHAGALRCFLPEARAALEGYSPMDRYRELDAEVAECDRVNRASYVDLRTYLADDILVKVDRASMGWSLEARAPFLDHAVVEAAARLPGHEKLRGLTTKWILRRQQGSRLPPSTLRRKKEGFSAPVGQWLAGPLRAAFLDLVTHERMRALGLDAAVAHGLHADLIARRGFPAYRLWALFTLALWEKGVRPLFLQHAGARTHEPGKGV
jgi:asparagine synthase (glutamine-hydrolysing)